MTRLFFIFIKHCLTISFKLYAYIRPDSDFQISKRRNKTVSRLPVISNIGIEDEFEGRRRVLRETGHNDGVSEKEEWPRHAKHN